MVNNEFSNVDNFFEGWRLRLLREKIKSRMKSWTHFLYRNALFGPLSAIALFSNKAFYPHYRVSSDKKTIEVDPTRPVHCYLSRIIVFLSVTDYINFIKHAWKYSFEKINDFERFPDSSFIGSLYYRFYLLQ